MIKPLFHNLRRKFAKLWLSFHSDLIIIGITGSYGKTNTATAITKVASKKYKVLQTDLNLDTNFNLPITLLKLREEKVLVLEYGVDHKKEMLRHLSLVKPKIGVITGIAPVHTDQEHLGSLEGVIEEKGYLLEALPKNGFALINYDDQKAREMASKTKAEIIYYGTNAECDIWADKPKVTLAGTEFTLHYKEETIAVKTNLIGCHYLVNLAAAAGVGIILGLTLKEIALALSELQPLEGRMSIEKGFNNTTLINDARRANLSSTIAGLQVLADLPGKRKIAVLGEMREMGEYSEKGHREVGDFVKKIKPTFLVTVGSHTKWIAEQAKKEVPVHEARDVFEAAKILKDLLQPGDLVYLKGSLLAHMERIPLILEGKKVDSDEIASKRYEIYR